MLLKKNTLVLILPAFLFLAGCVDSGPACERSAGDEAELVISMSKDQLMSYPDGFYVDVSPAAYNYYSVLTPSAESKAEADALFDYVNTSTSRYYIMTGYWETDKYYKRRWNSSYTTPGYTEVIFKDTYLSWDPAENAFVLVSADAAKTKELAELWLLNFNYDDYYGAYYRAASDIVSSEVAEDAGAFSCSIRYAGYEEGCGCMTIPVYEFPVTVDKSTGIAAFSPVTKTAEYTTGNYRECGIFWLQP